MNTKRFTNRIVEHREMPLDEILFHDGNWKIHPANQQQAVDYSLQTVGWVDEVMINMRSHESWGSDRGVMVLVNGHLRCTLAARAGEKTVPVKIVDLLPDEEAYVLATFDPLGAMARADAEKTAELAARLDTDQEAVRAALRAAGHDARKDFAHLLPNGATLQPQGGLELPKPKKADAGQADSERYPLAIVLDRRDYQRWLDWREMSGAKNDKMALLSLLGYIDKAKETEDIPDD